MFVFPLPEPEAQESYGEAGYDAAYIAAIRPWFETLARMRADRLDTLVPHGRTRLLLDVGSGYGVLLGEAASRGWDALGIEPSRFEAEYAAREFGASVVSEPAGRGLAQLGESRFDAVTFWHVAEHLLDARECLQRAIELLRPGGVLVVNSPNIDSAIYWLVGRRWDWIYTPGHVQYFSVHGLAKWIEGKGLNVATKETLAEFPPLYHQLECAALAVLSAATARARSGPVRQLANALARYRGSAFHEGRLVVSLLWLHRHTPFLDRFLRSKLLGHEFFIAARKPAQ